MSSALKAPTWWGDNRQVPGIPRFSVSPGSAWGCVHMVTKATPQPQRMEEREQ